MDPELGQWRPRRARQRLSHAEFVLRERVRECCPFTVGPWASAHAGEHVTSKQVSRTSRQRPEHRGARDLCHQMLSFLHAASGTSEDIAARKFLGWDTAGVLASWGQRLVQLSARGKLPASPWK